MLKMGLAVAGSIFYVPLCGAFYAVLLFVNKIYQYWAAVSFSVAGGGVFSCKLALANTFVFAKYVLTLQKFCACARCE